MNLKIKIKFEGKNKLLLNPAIVTDKENVFKEPEFSVFAGAVGESIFKIDPKIRDATCKCFAHDWTNSCIVAAVDLFFASCFGTLRFFLFFYLARYLSTVIKKKKKSKVKDLAKFIFRSAMCVTAISTGTLSFSCLFRRWFGRYYYPTMCYIPATIASFSILWESPQGKDLAANYFANCGLEYWFWELKRKGLIRWTPNQQTAVFMIFTSLLSYLLSRTDFKQQYYWFFIPPKVSDCTTQSKTCFHDNICWKYNWKNFIMYSTTGFILQLAKVLIYNFKTPKVVLSALISPKTFKLAAFLGCYVSVFEAVRCYLYRREKKHSDVHDAIAGFFAGATFRFQPTIQILNTGVISVIQIFTETLRESKTIPDISYTNWVFIFFCGLLFHVKILLDDDCPPLMKYIFSTVTHYRADKVTQNYKNFIKAAIV